MKTKPIIAGAVVVLLLLTIVFIISRPSPPPITVRHVKSVQSGRWVTATFEITNETARSYFVYPVLVEVRNGQVWKTCFGVNPPQGPFSFFGPHYSKPYTLDLTNLPTGSPLRLRVSAFKELVGLERFVRRLDRRFQKGEKNVSVNPFDRSYSNLGRAEIRAEWSISTEPFSSKLTQAVSDEFVEPVPK